MHDSDFVRRFQPFAESDDDVECLGNWHFSGDAHTFTKRFAFDILHRKEWPIVILGHLINMDNVGMIECGDGLHFAGESRAQCAVGGQVAWQEFQRHTSIEFGVIGEIDFPHASGADLGDDPVVADQRAIGQHSRTGR